MIAAVVVTGALFCAPPPPQVYTNDDLARVRPFAAETGGASEPATVPKEPAPSRPTGRGSAGRGEDYLRREAERTAARIEPLERQADELRRKIAERERQKGVMPVSDPQLRSLRERLARTEERARRMQADLEDRARRAGALPGWLR